jgi:hypothetical protein
MNTTVQVLSGVAMVMGGYGSMLFVDTETKPADYPLGSKVFLVGNTINVAVGLHIGDYSMVGAQAGLAFFTLLLVKELRFTAIVGALLSALILWIGIAHNFHFTASGLGVFASSVAIFGAWAMWRGKLDIMNWCWVVADLVFIYIAILNQLVGLFLVACLFTWHGYLRITGKKLTGLFSYVR